MRPAILAFAAAASLAAGCDRAPTPDPAAPPQPQVGSTTPHPGEPASRNDTKHKPEGG